MKKNKIKSMFVNLLMKHGKKSRALYLLEVSVYLFIQSLLKIKKKTVKYKQDLKEKNNTIFKNPLQNSNSIATYKEDNGAPLDFSLKGKALEQQKAPSSLYAKNPLRAPKGGENAFILFDEKTSREIFVHQSDSRFFSYPLKFSFLQKNCMKSTDKEEKNFQHIFAEPSMKVPPVFSALDFSHLQKIFPFLRSFSPFFLNFYVYQASIKNTNEKIRPKKRINIFSPEGVYRPQQNKIGSTHLHRFLEIPLASVFQRVFATQKKKVAKCSFNEFFSDTSTLQNSWYKSSRNRFCFSDYTEAQKNTHLHYLYAAISNVKPPLECKSKRFGGSNRQIPATVSEDRQWSIAISWIIEAATNQKNKKKKASLGVSLLQGPSTRASKDQKPQKTTFNRSLFLSAFRKKAQNRRFESYSENPDQRKQGVTFLEQTKALKRNDGFSDKGFLYTKRDNAKTEFHDTRKERRKAFFEKYTPAPLVDAAEKGGLELQDFKQQPTLESAKYTPEHTRQCETLEKEHKSHGIKKPFLGQNPVFSLQSIQSTTALPHFCFFLAEALQNAYYRRGPAIEKRNLWVDSAVTNRAYLRDRWW